jgi:hypothetical protein
MLAVFKEHKAFWAQCSHWLGGFTLGVLVVLQMDDLAGHSKEGVPFAGGVVLEIFLLGLLVAFNLAVFIMEFLNEIRGASKKGAE